MFFPGFFGVFGSPKPDATQTELFKKQTVIAWCIHFLRTKRDILPTPLFKPSHSGNPGGRPELNPEMRKLPQSKGETAVKRLNDPLSMDELFNRIDGNGEFVSRKLSGTEQFALLALAQDRAFGRADGVSTTHTHSGTVSISVNPPQRLKDIRVRLPERLAQEKVIEAILDDDE